MTQHTEYKEGRGDYYLREGLRDEIARLERTVAAQAKLIARNRERAEFAEKASTDALMRAVAAEARVLGLAEPIDWIVRNHPKVMREMPTHLYRKIKAAEEAAE